MLRLDEDVFKPYFEEAAPPAWAEEIKPKTKASL
jgi:hypothetical protein